MSVSPAQTMQILAGLQYIAFVRNTHKPVDPERLSTSGHQDSSMWPHHAGAASIALASCSSTTRGDQKVLQFSMKYKWHIQNNHIIVQCNIPLYQYTSDICQKVPLFQPNRIPGTCCWDTTPWPTWAHRHRKTSFREGAASDVEIGRSRWVSGLLSKMGETAA